mgnify:FL=1|jgi:hypothetical protein
MKRFSIIICLLCAIISNMCAQHISRRYHDRSMSDVLIDLDKSSSRYKISFIYNELEDFTVTQNVNEQNIPDAIRRVIGFYPMKMTVGDSLITVECIRKGERKLIGRLMDNHNLPVEFANVQLLSAKDSSFLCGGVIASVPRAYGASRSMRTSRRRTVISVQLSCSLILSRVAHHPGTEVSGANL